MNAEADPQNLLPEDQRPHWAVVPRDALYQLVLVGLLLGAGAAVSVVGFIQRDRLMYSGFPLAVLACWLQNAILPWSEKRLLTRLVARSAAIRPSSAASRAPSPPPPGS
jgi:hypothetical protein